MTLDEVLIRLRIILALAGFIAAILAVALDERRIAWVAISLLAVSLILRLVAGKRDREKRGNDSSL